MTVVVHNTAIWLPRTEIWIYNQVAHLPPDFDVHVVCRATQNLDQFGRPNIHCLGQQPTWRRLADGVLRKLRVRRSLGLLIETARTYRADLIHSHFGHVGWTDMEAARATGARHVVSFYGLDVNFLPRQNPRWRSRYAELFAHVDAILCEGPHMGRCIAALGCPEDKIRVNHLGISVRDIAFEPLQWRPGDTLRVLIAASFREKKGIPIALEALGRLQHSVPLEATLIGDAGDDPRALEEKAKIETAINRHGLDDKIRRLGYVPHTELMAEARRHHIFLSPSMTASDGDTEGGAPVSLIDMAAGGLLIVSTTHCDIPEIVRHGETGLLSEEYDVDGLVVNLQCLVDNPGDWQAMRVAARNLVEGEFDARIQAEKLAQIYKSLLN